MSALTQTSESRAVKFLHGDIDHPARQLRRKVDLLGQITAAIRQRMQGDARRMQPGIVAVAPLASAGLRRRLSLERLDVRRQRGLRAGQLIPWLGQRIIVAFDLGEGLDQIGELAERVPKGIEFRRVAASPNCTASAR